jgi:hypothetical protein
MEPALSTAYVNLISQNVSWFNRLRETNVWAALIPDSEQNEQEEREKIHTVRQAGLKPRRSFRYTTIKKKILLLTVLLLFAECIIGD